MTNTQGIQGSQFTSVSSNQGPYQPTPLVFLPAIPRDPNSADIGYPLCQLWFNQTNFNLWILVKLSISNGIVVAQWNLLAAGTGLLAKLSGNIGSNPVFPDASNNINVFGDGTSIDISGDGISTLTANVKLPGAFEVLFSDIFNNAIQGVTLDDLQVVVGITGGAPVPATLTAGAGITINYVPGSPNEIIFTASATGLTYTSISFVDSPYTVLLTDEYISVDTSGGPVIIKFPDNPGSIQVWIVKDRTGNASTNNITLTTVSGVDTFDGVTSFLLKGNFDAQNVLFNGSNYEVF